MDWAFSWQRTQCKSVPAITVLVPKFAQYTINSAKQLSSCQPFNSFSVQPLNMPPILIVRAGGASSMIPLATHNLSTAITVLVVSASDVPRPTRDFQLATTTSLTLDPGPVTTAAFPSVNLSARIIGMFFSSLRLAATRLAHIATTTPLRPNDDQGRHLSAICGAFGFHRERLAR